MALVRSNLAVIAQSASNDQKFSVWLYKSSTDTLATIAGAGYFGSVVSEGVIREDDVIFVIDSGGNAGWRRFNNATNASTIALLTLS